MLDASSSILQPPAPSSSQALGPVGGARRSHVNSPLNWITNAIAIGNFLDAEDRELHRSSVIRSLVCLSGRLCGVLPETLGLDFLENFDLKDGPGNDPATFRRAVEAVARAASRYPKLLVQCHAGRSRSVVVVAAHLMRSQGMSMDEALAHVASKREVALTAGIEKLLHSPFLYQSRAA